MKFLFNHRALFVGNIFQAFSSHDNVVTRQITTSRKIYSLLTLLKPDKKNGIKPLGISFTWRRQTSVRCFGFYFLWTLSPKKSLPSSSFVEGTTEYAEKYTCLGWLAQTTWQHPSNFHSGKVWNLWNEIGHSKIFGRDNRNALHNFVNQLLNRTRSTCSGIVHQTMKQYVLRNFS